MTHAQHLDFQWKVYPPSIINRQHYSSTYYAYNLLFIHFIIHSNTIHWQYRHCPQYSHYIVFTPGIGVIALEQAQPMCYIGTQWSCPTSHVVPIKVSIGLPIYWSHLTHLQTVHWFTCAMCLGVTIQIHILFGGGFLLTMAAANLDSTNLQCH